MKLFVEVIVPLLFLIVGFGMLVKGADIFVEGSSRIAKKLGVSQLFIALTIVAMGTSIPETAVSLFAALKGNEELALGNIVGTNILNIMLILGFTAMLTPLAVSKSTVKYEMPIMIFTAIAFSFLGLGINLFTGEKKIVDGMFTRADGIILLALFGLYLIYLFRLARKTKSEEEGLVPYENKISWPLLILISVAGLALVIVGSDMVVKGASRIAEEIGISQRIIGLTVVAFGTSLPELATSVTAAIKNRHDLAVGNIVGSNIYNMLFIGGITSVIKPVPYSASFMVDSLVCVGASVLLLLLLVLNRKKMLTRFSGATMLCLYSVYLVSLCL
ncbi:calcium/sodium antiporter [Treponema sp.]|uniref:calcium/sodium antiporter n=1 Tax=Treponema sp. TaxID=166 RepID=UPI00298EC583|nr:calcium/sodium antiporter [Treponema sp.]MCQ2240205.1 calcium/sodium antiporter [Treponema sp.]